MAKSSGIGDRLYVGAYDLSGDTQALRGLSVPISLIDVTDITQDAYERRLGARDAMIGFTSFHDIDSGASHELLSQLKTTDQVMTYAHGTTIGNPAASMVAKQINYDGARPTDASFLLQVDGQTNGYPLYWGVQLTAGLRTDTGATNGASYDTTASADFGWAMAVHLTAISGGGGDDITITVEDSADDAAFATVSGATTGSLSAVGDSFVVASSGTATVRRYIRAVTSTSGGFTSATFMVNFCKGSGAEMVIN